MLAASTNEVLAETNTAEVKALPVLSSVVLNDFTANQKIWRWRILTLHSLKLLIIILVCVRRTLHHINCLLHRD